MVQYEYAFILDTAASTGLETALDSRGGGERQRRPERAISRFMMV